jgi:hypothetical protein
VTGHLARFCGRLLSALRPSRAEASLDREIASHLALLEESYRARGLSPEDARRSAHLALGGVAQTKEQHRDALAFRWLDDARRDGAYAVRVLRRSPVASAAAALLAARRVFRADPAAALRSD